MANNVVNTMEAITIQIMEMLNAVFLIPFKSLMPAEKIKYITHTWIPLKAYDTRVNERNASKKREITYIIKKDGMHTAMVAVKEPVTPRIL